MTSAIIVASGSSQRMGFDKLLAPLAGQPLLRQTIGAFLAADTIDTIVVVCPADRWNALGELPATKPLTRVDGGDSRQASVANGLAAVPVGTTHVAVHDGARPLVSASDIDRCVTAGVGHRAATLARRATETMKRSDSTGFITEAVSRDNLWFMETPQAFSLDLLQEAYAHVTSHNLTVTDEVSALQAISHPVLCVESQHPNPKVTTPADLALAEAMLKTR